MKYYPIFLRVTGRACLVIGGGTVGAGKVASLLGAGAAVTVVSPTLAPALAARVAAGAVRHHARAYRTGDLDGFLLAYAATRDAGLHEQIARDAAAAGVLLNVVDVPHLCSFIVPSVMQQGDLVIAVSTGGASPVLARRIRQSLQEEFGPEYGLALRVLGRLRAELTHRAVPVAERRRIFGALVDSPLIDYLRDGQDTAVDDLLAATVGTGVSLKSLGVERGA